jgi:chromosome segregation ATPase
VSDESIDSESKMKNKADNDGLQVVKDLQEALKREKELKQTIAGLQEKLSVSNAKETKLKEELEKYKGAVITLSDTSKKQKELQSQINALNEQLKQRDEQLTAQSNKSRALVEGRREEIRKSRDLNEKLSQRDEQIVELKSQLRESVKQKESLEKSLNEELEQANAKIDQIKAEADVKKNEIASKLSKATSLAEKYQKMAYNAVERYIDTRANMLGVTSNEIKNRLSESYTFDDIDRVCEDLQEYQLNISALPFDVSKSKSKKVVVKESKETIGLMNNADDTVDEDLLRLAKLL